MKKNNNIIIVKINPEPTKMCGKRSDVIHHYRDPLDDISKESWEEIQKILTIKRPESINIDQLFIFGTSGKMDNYRGWEDFWKEEDKLKTKEDETI